MPIPKSNTKTWEFSPVSISPASAMPIKSAPTLIEFAANSAQATMISTQRGNFSRSAPPSPRPVTIPIRAHMNCTQPMNGQVRNAVHNWAVPNCAPAIEYVAIPDGSSSAAPVIRPGPRTEKKRLSGFFLAERGITRCDLETVPLLPLERRSRLNRYRT